MTKHESGLWLLEPSDYTSAALSNEDSAFNQNMIAIAAALGNVSNVIDTRLAAWDTDDDGKVDYARSAGREYTVTLTAANWSAGKTQEIAVVGMTAGTSIDYGPNDDTCTAAQRLQYINAILSAKTQDGKILFAYDGVKPTSNLPVLIRDWGVMGT